MPGVIPQLGASPEAPFPPVAQAAIEPDGLLAWGGDLAPQRLLSAYRHGIFPWYAHPKEILWWSPSRRCVLAVEALHISRRLERTLRRGRFELTADEHFAEVIQGCIETRPSTWILPEMKRAYEHLHGLGYAHCVAAWRDGQLAGGVYGVSLGGLFFAESMFHYETDASKVALVGLCRFLEAQGHEWLDCQFQTPHLESLGAVLVSRPDFMQRLERLLTRPDLRGTWTRRFAETRTDGSKRRT